MREALVQLNALKGLDYGYGEDRLRTHRTAMATQQVTLQELIAAAAKADVSKLSDVVKATEELLQAYNTDLGRVKWVTREPEKKSANAKKVAKPKKTRAGDAAE